MPVAMKSCDDFEQNIEDAKKNKKVIIAKFSTSWCNPCKQIAPHYYDLERQYGDMIFLDIDCEEGDNEEIVDEYKVKNLPTFIVIKDGKEECRLTGSDKKALSELVSKHFKDSVTFCMDDDF
eukprot:UN04367